MDAVILAGGFATRLYPLTLKQSKPLLKIAGQPCIYNILEGLFPLRRVGLNRIIVVSNEPFVSDFRNELSGPFPVDVVVESNGVRTLDEKLGAVGDMAFGAHYVEEGEPFWILAGDNMHDFDLLAVHRRFESLARAPVVVTHRAETLEEVAAYNNMALDSEGCIRAFEEKPARPETTEFATCIYEFPSDVRSALSQYLEEGNDPDKAGYFIAWLKDRRKVFAVEPEGKWFDIGSKEVMDLADKYFS